MVLFYDRNKKLKESTEDIDTNYDQSDAKNIEDSDNINEVISNCDYKRKRPRLVQKCGELNINTHNVPKRKRRLLSDIFNVILDIKWRWHIIIFLLSFFVSWFFFAIIWYTIAFLHDDIDYNHDDNFTNSNSNMMPCVSGVHDFTSALLYSIETQHTIGYGHRHITEECPFAIVFLMLQSCIGIFVQGLVAGVVFAKLSRPNKRKRTIIFSHHAVVTERDGKLCLLFKIGNIRISQLSDARIKLILIKSRITSEGEYVPFESYNLKVGQEWSGRDSIFFPWPKIVEHVIDENSPLHEIYQSENKIESDNDDYEIVVILEGNIETTGASCHIRTSYLPDEILWGYRFMAVYPYINNNSSYTIDFSKFNQVEPVNPNLFHLNRTNNYPKILSKLNKSGKNYTKSLPLPSFSFMKQASSLAQQTTSISSNYSSKVSLESIFVYDNSIKSKITTCSKENSSRLKKNSSTNNMPVKTGRFTVVPVDNIETCDETKNGKTNDSVDSLVRRNHETQTNDSTITSSTHLDEGYLTCKQVDDKKNNSNKFLK